MQARLVQLMQKLSPDHFDWATSIVLGRYPGAVQVSIAHASTVGSLIISGAGSICCWLTHVSCFCTSCSIFTNLLGCCRNP